MYRRLRKISPPLKIHVTIFLWSRLVIFCTLRIFITLTQVVQLKASFSYPFFPTPLFLHTLFAYTGLVKRGLLVESTLLEILSFQNVTTRFHNHRKATSRK